MERPARRSQPRLHFFFILYSLLHNGATRGSRTVTREDMLQGSSTRDKLTDKTRGIQSQLPRFLWEGGRDISQTSQSTGRRPGGEDDRIRFNFK